MNTSGYVSYNLMETVMAGLLVLFLIIVGSLYATQKQYIYLDLVYVGALLLSISFIIYGAIILSIPDDYVWTFQTSSEPILGMEKAGVFCEFTRVLKMNYIKGMDSAIVDYYPVQNKLTPGDKIGAVGIMDIAPYWFFIIYSGTEGCGFPITPPITKENMHDYRLGYHNAFNRLFQFDSTFLSDLNGFIPANTLGVHIRYTGHYNTSMTLDEQLEIYYAIIANESFDYIFLATHLTEVLDKFKLKYGTGLIYRTDHYRNDKHNADWVDNPIAKREERTNAMRDAVLLSKCKKIIGGPSNVFYSALWLNLDLEFIIPDILNRQSK